jgi:hypothetical protein
MANVNSGPGFGCVCLTSCPGARPSGRLSVRMEVTKRLICGLAMLKRRERRVPQQLGFGGTIKMHTIWGLASWAGFRGSFPGLKTPDTNPYLSHRATSAAA